MNFPNKTFLISDPLHGSIQISELEKRIISTEIFNRLHHILQNSTVYLTYPSNKTSRFLHSIGVMHLGSEMYRYSITNGLIAKQGETVNTFFEVIKSFIKDLENNNDFKEDIKKNEIDETYCESYNKLIKSEWLEPFYTANLPHGFNNESLYHYVITLQAVRCVALLHDLGHPPFSHVTETALENIYKEIQNKKGDSKSLTQREAYFDNILEEYMAEDKLHERIGKKLTGYIFDRIISNEEDIDKKFFYLHIKYLSKAILYDDKGKYNVFSALHNIIDGEIDCDRLDYVSRDSIASGINSGLIEYPRLYKSMKILLVDNEFIFCPSSHILGTIEDYFNRRWRMYKNIIFHHRVVKTDNLLREVIEKLAYRYLLEDYAEKSVEGHQIPTDISGLWKTLEIKVDSEDAIYRIIQWDDAWLLACLRTEYFKIISSNSDNDFEIKSKLQELLSNKKNYTSLFKRSDGFEELDTVIIKHFNIKSLDKFKDDRTVRQLVNKIYMYKDKPQKNKLQLFSFLLDELFGKHKKLGHDTLDRIIKDSVLQVVGDSKYFIYKRNKIKTGIGEPPRPAKIHTGDELFLLEEYSNINTILTTQKGLFAPYYLYIHKDKVDDLNKMRLEIGKSIAGRVSEYLLEVKN